jgi:hypothetical protein|tara:strand:- start:276 stop:422 length:147 start_codon:yes stop_codon:yes gene_type:complete
MSVEGIPIWMVEPLEALSPEAIERMVNADNTLARLDRAKVMVVRVPCR